MKLIFKSFIEDIKKYKVPIIYSFSLTVIILINYLNPLNKILFSILVSINIVSYFIAIIYENKSKDFIDKVLNFTLFVLLASPFLVYIVILLMKIFRETITPVGNESSWIGFFGALIGGSMVMFGVIFTMQHENSINEENNKNSGIPILKLGIETLDTDDDFEEHGTAYIKDKWALTVTNIYKNPARNIETKTVQIEFSNEKKSDLWKNQTQININDLETQNILAEGEPIYFAFYINSELIPDSIFKYMRLNIILEYFDISGKNKYEQNLTIIYENNSMSLANNNYWDEIIVSGDRKII